MLNINITNFRKNVYDMLKNTIKYNEPLIISTKEGNAVVISEEEYNSIVETLYLYSNPKVKDQIIEGLNTSIKDCIPETEVEW